MLLPTRYKRKPPLSVRALRPPIGAGIAGAWLCNERSGTQVFDVSGNHCTGDLLLDTHFVPGLFGRALDFDGNNDEVKMSQDYPSLKITGPMTILCWVRKTGDKNAMEFVIGKGSAWGAGKSYTLAWNTNTNSLYWYLRKPDDSGSVVAALSVPYDTKWHQIIATFTGQHGRIYYDTVIGPPSLAIAAIYDSTLKVEFGCQLSSWDFVGQIDHVVIWNRALVYSEIVTLYYRPFCWLGARGRHRLYVPAVAAVAAGHQRHIGFKPIEGPERLRGLLRSA